MEIDNSASTLTTVANYCQIITIFNDFEAYLVESNEAMIRVHSKDEYDVNIAEVVDIKKYKQIMQYEVLCEDYDKYINFVEELWQNIVANLKEDGRVRFGNYVELCKKYNVEKALIDNIETFMHECSHKIAAVDCVSNVRHIVNVNGQIVSIASWKEDC